MSIRSEHGIFSGPNIHNDYKTENREPYTSRSQEVHKEDVSKPDGTFFTLLGTVTLASLAVNRRRPRRRLVAGAFLLLAGSAINKLSTSQPAGDEWYNPTTF